MAGVVAMASVIEDFDTQPCKKSRKDGGSPVVKTITSYFSPVPKPVEKHISPRANNMMDYFSKNTLSTSKVNTSSPEEPVDNSQRAQLAKKDIGRASESAVKQPTPKRGRKPSKATRKLVDAVTISLAEDDSCSIVEELPQSADSAAVSTSICGVFGSDTAALLVELCAENSAAAGTSESKDTNSLSVELDKNNEHEKHAPKSGTHLQPGPDLYTCTSTSSSVLPAKLKAKQVRPSVRTSRKSQKQDVNISEPKEKEADNSMCDVSMEDNVVMITFEDFLRSQSQDEGEGPAEDKHRKENNRAITREAEETDVKQLETAKGEINMASGELCLQVSPRTVTIQAEVHALSPKQEAVKTVGRLASIFNREKAAVCPAEVEPSPQAESELPSIHLTGKRKSNVVLQEEDLELAIIESESTSKCCDTERRQFMAAFKQPSLDGSKGKPAKIQGKQRQPVEKSLDDKDKDAVEDIIIQENKVATKKPARRGRKKAEAEKDEVATIPADATEETMTTANSQVEKVEEPVTNSFIPELRRSRREAVVRQATKSSPTTTDRDTGEQEKLKETDCPSSTRRSKHGIYAAELVGPPDTKESPIRIKFTRVCQNVPPASDKNSTLVSKTSNGSKKERKKAKKLVEKAIAIQHNKKAKSPVRRSSRTEASIKRSYCEDEDSVICLEDDPTAAQTIPDKSKSQKRLRSLNDVLGKRAPLGKETKTPTGSKMAMQGQEKNARRGSAVVSIFDESSLEASENSQDDEQFKARREFLKSGLPESFRKQIAKAAATKEAYSLSCSSFQPVTHVTQQPHGCSSPWPESTLLRHLKELWGQTSNPPVCLHGFLGVKNQPVRRVVCERGSGWRPELSESVRQLLTEEVSACNPSFPYQLFISHFLARRTEAVTRVTSSLIPAEPLGGKRKRTDDEGAKGAKKQRATGSEEINSTPEPESSKRGGRPRRGQRARLDEEAKEKPSHTTAPILPEDDSVVVLDDVVLVEENDVVREDVLWTEKYQPQHSSDIIGNTAAVRRLHSWLKEWKLRADREDRNKQKDKKQEEGSNDSDWDCEELDSHYEEDSLCNTVLITGPSGVGKTATVYACAQELGFKVFEVNASSQRSGRLILSQLKEATQSHQVDSQGVNAHKPTYFNSYSSSSSAGVVRHGLSPRKMNSPHRVVSSPRKPQSPRGGKRGGIAPTSLSNFFKTGRPTNKERPLNTKKDEIKAASKTVKASERSSKQTDPEVKPLTAATPKISEDQSKKTATSLILFEEVDVIFDDDSGFLSAIKTFMTTTKRPVILTTSDPAFSTMFDGHFDEIHFKIPSLLDVCSYLRLLCLAEDMRTDPSDISSLLRLNGCDIRQSLLQLQYWTRSAGGRSKNKNTDLKLQSEAADTSESAAKAPSTLPPCDTGCAESLLGLLNIEPQSDVWELTKMEDVAYWEVLKENNRRGVNLLYSNMEALLPLPLTQLSTTHKQEACVSVAGDQPVVDLSTYPLSDTRPPNTELLHPSKSAECSDDGSPIKVSHRMRKNKRRYVVRDQDDLHSDSDSGDSFLSLCRPQQAPQTQEVNSHCSAPERVKRKPLTPEERLKSLSVSQCLGSIADFLDHMSDIDSSLLSPHGGDLPQRNSPFCAAVKDGMMDESRTDTDKLSWTNKECVLEVQAAVEALSFQKCRLSVAEAWNKAQQLEGEVARETATELTLPLAAHRQGYSFMQDSPCQPQLVQRRRDIVESLMFRGVFGTLGNRRAAAVDYLPVLRSICRSEQLKEQGKVKRRFLHYLDSIHLGVDKGTLQYLSEDFP